MRLFASGDKVVCIDARFHPSVAALYTALPKQDSVYVVRDVRLGIQPDCKTGDVSITLVGLVNPPAASKAGLERGFSQERFRHLDELKIEDAHKTMDVVGREMIEAGKETVEV